MRLKAVIIHISEGVFSVTSSMSTMRSNTLLNFFFFPRSVPSATTNDFHPVSGVVNSSVGPKGVLFLISSALSIVISSKHNEFIIFRIN